MHITYLLFSHNIIKYKITLRSISEILGTTVISQCVGEGRTPHQVLQFAMDQISIIRPGSFIFLILEANLGISSHHRMSPAASAILSSVLVSDKPYFVYMFCGNIPLINELNHQYLTYPFIAEETVDTAILQAVTRGVKERLPLTEIMVRIDDLRSPSYPLRGLPDVEATTSRLLASAAGRLPPIPEVPIDTRGSLAGRSKRRCVLL